MPFSPPTLLDKKIQPAFLKSLFLWFKKMGRHDMPWRKTTDAYAILLSEFMLQQTTVATVLPYYHRFLKRFPTLADLARADLDQVLDVWSGLGYYARARNLWTSARSIANDLGGAMPDDAASLEKLPGIGPYTAGAVSSFAFNKPAPVLDGNIIRVFMRLLAIEDDPKMKPVQALLKKLSLDLALRTLQSKGAQGINGKKGPRDLNLALMDLGSTVCVPQNPDCSECPVAAYCLAYEHRLQDRIPPKGDAVDRPVVTRLYAVIPHQGQWLMAQCLPKGLFAGLWEFPGVDVISPVEPVPYLENQLNERFSLPVRVTQALPAFEHQLSHRVFRIRPFLCEWKKASSAALKTIKKYEYQSFEWVGPEKGFHRGISRITSKIFESLPKA